MQTLDKSLLFFYVWVFKYLRLFLGCYLSWTLTFQYQAFHACFYTSLIMQSYNSKPKSRTNREKFSFMSSSENIYCLDGETFCLDDLVALLLRCLSRHSCRNEFLRSIDQKGICFRSMWQCLHLKNRWETVRERLCRFNENLIWLKIFLSSRIIWISSFSSQQWFHHHSNGMRLWLKQKTRFTYIIYECGT